ncbi:MAG: Kdo hydroxylase family protein [Betaproteobacteria bacterium]
MNPISTLDLTRWNAPLQTEAAAGAMRALESGAVLFMPHLNFTLTDGERRFLSPLWLEGAAKNVSYDPRAAKIAHTSAANDDRAQLAALMARYAEHARALVAAVCPHYGDNLDYGLTSFRPVETRGRATSPKKDDTRLHVDAFASRPNQGLRILRVFSNVNPRGEPRVWEIGEPFEAMAQRFAGRVPPQWPGSAWLQEKLRITKGRRSAYDHVMLSLHDTAKLDDGYQRTTQRTHFDFPAHSTWIVFTDRVMHAALAGQFLLEQTFYLPVAAMQDERYAPLRILESICRRKLA